MFKHEQPPSDPLEEELVGTMETASKSELDVSPDSDDSKDSQPNLDEIRSAGL